jgi:predicted regulator of Ras-like GTPase activity (Roadblock/LC7/MglB family)
MPGLPPLIEEDVVALDAVLNELLRRSEADTALIIDKGGPLICQRGAVDKFDTTTIAALAAGSFSATQAIAERIGETGFSNIYQQGDRHSLLFCNVEADLLLVVIFQASAISVGVVKYYAEWAVGRINEQLQKARQRSPQGSMDLVSMNVVDVSNIFRRKPSA